MDLALLADKGGVGKSTLAVHVAGRLKQLGHAVDCVDLDDLQVSKTWLTLSPDQIPCWGEGEQVPANPGSRVWDTPGKSGRELRAELVQACDLSLLVVTDNLASHLSALKLWQELPNERLWVVLNNLHPRGEHAGLRAALERQGLRLCRTAVRRFACYTHAQYDGRLVCDWPYPSADAAWSDIVALTEEILNHAQ